MVLLSGTNYDYASQENTVITKKIGIGNTKIYVENTSGFSADDYFVIGTNTESAEIVKISTVVDDFSFTTSATKFDHAIGSYIYRLPFNQMKFYSSTTATGTFTEIAGSTTDMEFSKTYTNFPYPTGTSSLYYKRTFYNETTAVESPISESEYWQTSVDELYITPEEMRVLLQFDENDPPSPEDMKTFIQVAQKELSFDIDSSDKNFLYLATFLLTKAKVMRALASKALSKGYITINVDGRNVTKAYQELILEGENTQKEYKTFLIRVGRSEVASTNFMDNTSIIDSETRTAYIDLWTGTSNGIRDSFSERDTLRRLRE